MTKKAQNGQGASRAVREVRIANKYGIHARPAALFVKTANQFACDIQVEKDGASVSAKSIMGLLTLEGHFGSRLRIVAEGADAHAAVAALEQLVARKFDED